MYSSAKKINDFLQKTNKARKQGGEDEAERGSRNTHTHKKFKTTPLGVIGEKLY